MSERKKIEDKLRKKQAEIASLEDKIKGARVYVQALQDVLKMLGGDEGAADIQDTKLRAGSAVAQAREVILARGEPVHLDELLQAMGKEITRDSKASLASSIAAYVRRDEIFTRPAPNTFGLAELGHATSTDEDDFEAPPSGFGRGPITKSAFDLDDDDVPF